MGSSDQAHPGGRPSRPVRAAGLRSSRVARGPSPSSQSRLSRLRPRPLFVVTLVAVLGVGLAWRLRTTTDAGPASSPTVGVVESVSTEVAADVRAQIAPPGEAPPPLTAEPPPGLAVSAPATPVSADVAAPTPGVASQSAQAAETVTPIALAQPSLPPTPSNTPIAASNGEASTQPEHTPTSAPTEEAGTQPENTPTSAPTEE